MSNPIVSPGDDAASKALAQSIAHIKANVATYGVTLEEVTVLETKAQDFATHLAAVTAQKAASAAVTAAKDAARAAVDKEFRLMVARIHAIPTVTDDQKIAAGITPHDTVKTSVMPPVPANLVVQGNGNGTNSMAWSRNGAPDRTEFIVEAKKPTDADFILVGVSHSTTFEHTGQKPGAPVTYRIRARRGVHTSESGTPVGVYL